MRGPCRPRSVPRGPPQSTPCLCNALLGLILLSCEGVTSLTLDAVKSLLSHTPRQAKADPQPANRSHHPSLHLYSPGACSQDSTRGRLRPPPKAPHGLGRGGQAQGLGVWDAGGVPAGGRWGPLPRKGCGCLAWGQCWEGA